ncbi:uncharacterized protein LOC143037560 [Oratosquilla oratoria]|uniref:uncharacterized protein LOC143037560 n=1 Tax=Oratosquilla oratoria TaxID=337810 RepID=UPI003F76B990
MPISRSIASDLKEKACQEYTVPYGEIEGLDILKLEMRTDHKDDKHKVQKLSLGHPSNRPTKVILLVGATGTGKTTLINAMVNYIFGVDFRDNFRFILIDDKDSPKRSQAESQTDFITAYIFHHQPGMPFDYSYVLIDSPGFGDTRGIQRDRDMMRQLQTFLEEDYGIDQVDGIGFVTPSSAARLTQTQRYVFDGLSSMFGKNVKSNIYVMATFADAKNPPVLEALKEAKVEYEGFYKFNNSAVYADNNVHGSDSDEDSDSDDEDSGYISKLFWEMGIRSMNNFFIKLGKTSPVSLQMTKDVLEERNRLQMCVVGLQNQIHLGLGKLANLEQERDMMARLDDDMTGSKDYEEEIEVPKIHKIDLSKREHVTNCIKCNMTCHYPCYIPEDSNKMNCAAMRDGSCTVCPSNCHWDVHKNMGFRFETTYVKEKRTVQELLDRYEKAKSGKQSKQQVIAAIETDMENLGKKLLQLIRDAQQHVEKLEAIALKPNPLSTKEYIDLMIESEKLQKKSKWEKRVEMLTHLKEEVGVLQGLRGKGAAASGSGEGLIRFFKDLMHN